jgi:hypothetical protein
MLVLTYQTTQFHNPEENSMKFQHCKNYKFGTEVRFFEDHAIAQAVSQWLPTALARVRSQDRSCGIFVGQKLLLHHFSNYNLLPMNENTILSSINITVFRIMLLCTNSFCWTYSWVYSTLVSYLGRPVSHSLLTEVFCGFPQSLQENMGIEPSTGSWPCPFRFLPIHYPLFIPPLNASLSELLTVLLNK